MRKICAQSAFSIACTLRVRPSTRHVVRRAPGPRFIEKMHTLDFLAWLCIPSRAFFLHLPIEKQYWAIWIRSGCNWEHCWGGKFTTSGVTVGECKLFATLHSLVLIKETTSGVKSWNGGWWCIFWKLTFGRFFTSLLTSPNQYLVLVLVNTFHHIPIS